MSRRKAGDNGWLEAAVAWEVCASIHQEYAKGKDALYTTRHADFVSHAAECRKLYRKEIKQMSDIFLNAAKMVCETGVNPCHAIFLRTGGNGFSNAAFEYRRLFTPLKTHWWWDGRDTFDNREANVYSLLLAHHMHLSGEF